MSRQITCKICKGITKLKYRGLFDNRHGYPGRFSLLKCDNCGFIQTQPQLTTKQLYKLYSDYYPRRDADITSIITYSRNIPTKLKIAEEGLGTTCHFLTKKGQKVLDIGCGTCQSLLEIRRLGGKAWGLDVDKNSQNVAKKLGLNFHLGTIHNCKFPKSFFDLITASQVLEHEPDPIVFLKDCKKFLTNNGEIILSFPNTDSLGRKVWGKKWLHWHIPYHLNHFNKKLVKIMVQKAGLNIKSIKTVTPNLWTVLQFRSYLNNVKIGKRDRMWDGGTSKSKTKKISLKINIQDFFLSKLHHFLQFNRLIDMLGLGESFVIRISK